MKIAERLPDHPIYAVASRHVIGNVVRVVMEIAVCDERVKKILRIAEGSLEAFSGWGICHFHVR
jgi:hypothetical protein